MWFLSRPSSLHVIPCFVGISFLSFLDVFWSPIGYLKYLILGAAAAVIVSRFVYGKEKTIWFTGVGRGFALLVGHAFITVILKPNDDAFVDLAIYLCIATVAVASHEVKVNIEFLFVFFVLIVVVWASGRVASDPLNFLVELKSVFSGYSSASALKFSVICYIFGLFAIYFLWDKKYGWFAVSVIGILVTSKRAAYLAMVLVILLHFGPAYIKHVLLSRVFVLLMNGGWIGASMFIGSDQFTSLMSDGFGLNAAVSSMGRNELYSAALEVASTITLIFGSGTGDLYSYLGSHPAIDPSFDTDKVLLHNEVLRLFIECGAIVLCLFLMFLYPRVRIRTTGEKCEVEFVYLSLLFINVVAFFDNVLIYAVVWYVLILLIQSSRRQRPIARRDPLFAV